MSLTTEPRVREDVSANARVLLAALPYMREHAGRVVVVKVGGAPMTDSALSEGLAEDVGLLRMVGIRPVVVHGGGPQITALSERLGLSARFLNGHRVTDGETLEVARMVLVGVVNQDLVATLNRHGTPAVGLSGVDGNLLLVARREGPRGQDLGFVGDVTGVNGPLLNHLLEVAVPVVASIGTDGHGQPYNVNADLCAAALAAGVGAAKLVVLTDVPGLMVGGELVSEVGVTEVERVLASGAVSAGMIPKLEAAVQAVRGGVARAHIVDGRVPHATIVELFTPEGIGTMVTPDGAAEEAR